MKIKQTILTLINNVDSRKRISDDLNVSDQMIWKHINQNKPNGRLTRLDALAAISKETGEDILNLCEDAKELRSQK